MRDEKLFSKLETSRGLAFRAARRARELDLLLIPAFSLCADGQFIVVETNDVIIQPAKEDPDNGQ